MNTYTMISKVLPLLLVVLSITSCANRKEIVYFQEVDSGSATTKTAHYETVFQPDDLLIINVSAIDMEAVRPFNLVTASYAVGNLNLTSQPKPQTYLIDSEGTIDFPVLGTIKMGGVSKKAAINNLKEKLKVYVNNPIVNIEIVNFKISVLGEVKLPGTYTIPNERITLIEAIGLAGDMNIAGKRNNVLVVRDVNGTKTYTRVDITKKDIFNSPVYYLKQNDVVYVEPNKARVQSSAYNQNTGVLLSISSLVLTLVSILIR